MTELLENIVSSEESSMKNKYLTFLIGEEIYGIEIQYVTEIVGIQPITELPDMPDCLNGIINLRGKIISVLDVLLRFKKQRIEYDDRTCIIVTELNGMSLGLIVNSVSEVLTIPDENVEDKPEIISKIGCDYIKNIGKIKGQVIFLLDCEKLLDIEMQNAVFPKP